MCVPNLLGHGDTIDIKKNLPIMPDSPNVKAFKI